MNMIKRSMVVVESTRKSTVRNDFHTEKSGDPQSTLDHRSTDRDEPAKKSKVQKKSRRRRITKRLWEMSHIRIPHTVIRKIDGQKYIHERSTTWKG